MGPLMSDMPPRRDDASGDAARAAEGTAASHAATRTPFLELRAAAGQQAP